MKIEKPTIQKWILLLSGLFALLELFVSFTIWFTPEVVIENIDLTANGVQYIVRMWAVRQFALGGIFVYAIIKKSASMLRVAYLFFLLMFLGDLVIGILQHEMGLIISAIVMCIISIVCLYFLSQNKTEN
ncbi:MAG TPA: hypothetical protein PLN13_01745 [Bacteroidia bacterium]|nr:hypothetical protein [Bacteroidia bacterium]HRH07278.1 hypothetical protein [Bacteroidia bacterium]